MPTFKELEFETWQRGASAYDRLFGRVTREAIAPALDALQLQPDARLLDICCGTGHAVAAALQRGVDAWGVDLAPAMVALARRLHPGGRFLVADAEALAAEPAAHQPGGGDATSDRALALPGTAAADLAGPAIAVAAGAGQVAGRSAAAPELLSQTRGLEARQSHEAVMDAAGLWPPSLAPGGKAPPVRPGDGSPAAPAAMAPPFEAGSFEAACCLFGLNHLPDQERAVAQALRLLRPGGLYAFTLWSTPGPTTFHTLVQSAIAAHGRGDVASPVIGRSPLHRFGEPAICSELLLAAGFEQPQVRALPLAFELDAPETVLELAATSPRVSLLLAAQSEVDRRRIEQAIVEGALACRQGDRIHLPIPALLAVGRRPA